MTIHSIGTDLAQIGRIESAIERRGARFLERVFTPAERAYAEARPQTTAVHLAGRFAVKEAVMKVLGTGWTSGVRWVDIEVVREPKQAPELRLHGRSAQLAAERGIGKIHISITHDAGLAMAVAVAEKA